MILLCFLVLLNLIRTDIPTIWTTKELIIFQMVYKLIMAVVYQVPCYLVKLIITITVITIDMSKDQIQYSVQLLNPSMVTHKVLQLVYTNKELEVILTTVIKAKMWAASIHLVPQRLAPINQVSMLNHQMLILCNKINNRLLINFKSI